MSIFLKWYEENGSEDAVVLSSTVSLARNLSGYPFSHLTNQTEREEIIQKITAAAARLDRLGLSMRTVDLQTMEDLQRMVLAEHRLASREFLRRSDGRVLLVSGDESVCLAIGGEDHLLISVTAAGLECEKTMRLAQQIDDLLEEQLTFAFQDRLGYLTASPDHLGTGMQASVMLHLFGMDRLSLTAKLANTVSKMGMQLHGVRAFGGTHDYQITNRMTLGLTEEQAAMNLETIVRQIIDRELAAQSECLQGAERFEDRLYRTLGELQFARRLSLEELQAALSLLRVGICQKRISLPPRLLNTLAITAGEASILFGKGEFLSAGGREEARAELVRARLSEIEFPK